MADILHKIETYKRREISEAKVRMPLHALERQIRDQTPPRGFAHAIAEKVDGVELSCLQFLVAGVIGWSGAMLFEHPVLSDFIAGIVPLAYAGILSCGVAYTLQIIGQKDLDPTVASLILSMESVFSVLAGFVLLHQTLSLQELSGCILVFAAVILVQLPDKKKV